MSADPVSETPLPVYAQPWAVRIGAAVIVVFTLLLGLAFLDRSQRVALETVSETTAVGDTAFFMLPDPALAPTPVAMHEGRALSLASRDPIEIRDTHTRILATDSERGLKLYGLNDAALPDERKRVGEAPAFLLKTAVNRYVIARPAAR